MQIVLLIYECNLIRFHLNNTLIKIKQKTINVVTY